MNVSIAAAVLALAATLAVTVFTAAGAERLPLDSPPDRPAVARNRGFDRAEFITVGSAARASPHGRHLMSNEFRVTSGEFRVTSSESAYAPRLLAGRALPASLGFSCPRVPVKRGTNTSLRPAVARNRGFDRAEFITAGSAARASPHGRHLSSLTGPGTTFSSAAPGWLVQTRREALVEEGGRESSYWRILTPVAITVAVGVATWLLFTVRSG